MNHRRRRPAAHAGLTGAAALVLLAAVLGAGCSSSSTNGSAAPTTEAGADTVPGVPLTEVTTVAPRTTEALRDAKVTLTTVASLGTAATALEQRPGTSDLYVAELAGEVVRLVPNGHGGYTAAPTAALDLRHKVGSAGEEGLLGLAFSHDGGTLYVSYAAPDGTSMVDTYRMDGPVAAPASRHNLLTVPHSRGRTIHKGGAIHLGPDGMLWLGLGDGGPEDDPQNNAQNPNLLLGKMLRIDPATGTTTVWASGLRNPYRFSFDAAGNIWIGDVGQNEVEEIDRLPADTPPGANFGWSGLEGTRVFRRSRVPARSVPPIVELPHSAGWCAVMGGVVVRDPRLVRLDGAYLFGDLCRPQIRAMFVDRKGGVLVTSDLPVQVRQLIDIDTDAAGRVYFLSQTGEISRLDPS